MLLLIISLMRAPAWDQIANNACAVFPRYHPALG